MEFRKLALKNRRLLILALSYWDRKAGKGPAATIAELTGKAVEWGYVAARQAPTGSTMDVWVKTGEVPAWAAKAAARQLIQVQGYEPQNAEEAAALALMLAEGFPDLDQSGIQALIPAVEPGIVEKAVECRKPSY